jgi:ubiquinone/menaquinone biosynthesis C-methylase UbiE
MLQQLRRCFVPAIVITVTATAALRAQNAQENAADAERLIKALAVQPGQTIGEIGAGGGELTIALARAVGASGRVLSNDINKETLRKIGVAVGEAGVTNVTLVDGRQKDTNFPASCCDAIFMRDVYHHFGDPVSMNASILQSLKPGGHLAIIDFTPPPGGENPPGGRALDNHHGVTSLTVERELKAAGFEIISSTETNQRSFMVVARRPLTQDAISSSPLWPSWPLSE